MINPRIIQGVLLYLTIPIFKVIRQLVLERKILKLFLSYMGVAAILVIWPRQIKPIFVAPRATPPPNPEALYEI